MSPAARLLSHDPGALGEALLAGGVVSEADLDDALAEHRRSGRPLGEVLVETGLAPAPAVAAAVAGAHGIEFVDLDEEVLDPAVTSILRESFARRRGALPVGWDGDRLRVAMANPTDVFLIDDVRSLTGFDVRPVMAEAGQLERAFDRVWSAGAKAEEILAGAGTGDRDAEGDAAPDGVVALGQASGESPVVRFVDHLLARAVEEGVSDLHLEPTERDLRVRFRIDGVLQDVMTVPRTLRAAVVSRLKILGGLNIAERRLPQDGRISATLAERQVDLRVVTLPTATGEAVVLRLLDRSSGLVSIDDLGFLPDAFARYAASFRRPWGAILVTGPTGSGKSTTLYATLNELNRPQLNIVTVEDPIEYRVGGIKQMQVNRKAGLTFASALRSVLRADPDIVLVGEIRDQETARIATEAALTGHLVLSTLHTNDAASTPLRLVEMGVEPFLVASAVDCVLAQRLARRLCEECRQPVAPPPELDRLAAGDERSADLAGGTWFAPAGCRACHRTGYRGRFALHEVMPLSEEIGRLVVERASTDEVRAAARAEGMRTLLSDGLAKAAQGLTSLEELLRVVAV